jgi:hypothetical protein
VQIKSHAQKVLKRWDEGEDIFRRVDENLGRVEAIVQHISAQMKLYSPEGDDAESECEIGPASAEQIQRRHCRRKQNGVPRHLEACMSAALDPQVKVGPTMQSNVLSGAALGSMSIPGLSNVVGPSQALANLQSINLQSPSELLQHEISASRPHALLSSFGSPIGSIRGVPLHTPLPRTVTQSALMLPQTTGLGSMQLQVADLLRQRNLQEQRNLLLTAAYQQDVQALYQQSERQAALLRMQNQERDAILARHLLLQQHNLRQAPLAVPNQAILLATGGGSLPPDVLVSSALPTQSSIWFQQGL